MADSDDDTFEVPLVNQRTFGGGLKLKRVKFVPESTSENSAVRSKQTPSEAEQRYLSIVLPKSSVTSGASTLYTDSSTPKRICDICKVPVNEAAEATRRHEASIVHQIAVEHADPPLAFDRNSKGHEYLQRYGWDATERKGLGAGGAGRLFPIKVKEKNDTVGLGMKFAKGKVPEKKVEKLGVKAIQKRDKEEKKRTKKLQASFYQDEKVLKYLEELG
jgi:hypothetical protein